MDQRIGNVEGKTLWSEIGKLKVDTGGSRGTNLYFNFSKKVFYLSSEFFLDDLLLLVHFLGYTYWRASLDWEWGHIVLPFGLRGSNLACSPVLHRHFFFEGGGQTLQSNSIGGNGRFSPLDPPLKVDGGG